MVGTVLAAAGDTWGIPGPTFLAIYLTVAAVAVVGAVVTRIRVGSAPVAGGTARAGGVDHLHPQQAAYLNGGPRLAVYTSLGSLRGAGAIGVSGRRLHTAGPLPLGATPLDRAVHQAAGNQLRTRDLATDSWVAGALDELRRDLERRGLVVDPARRTAVKTFRLLLFALFGVGVFRLFNGLENDKPVGYLALSVVVVFVALLATGRLPNRTRAGTRELRRLRDQHRHLSPARSPAYATYGHSGAALGIALFGAASLWAIDPAFATEAEIHRSTGGGDSGGSWSSCSGGSSDGGSSSGGGSGCGGGSSCGGGGGGGCGG